MIEQAADVGVVERLGGGGVAIGLGDFGIGHEGLDQSLKVRVLESGDEIGESLPEFVDVLGGFGEVVGEVDFGVAEATQLVDGELEAVLVLVDEAFDFDEVVLVEGVKGVLNVVPHLGFELAAAVPEGEGEIGLAGLLRLNLLRDDHEAGSDDLVFLAGAVGDKEFFHARWVRGGCRAASDH